MSSGTSAFSPVRNASVSSDEQDGKSANVYFARNDNQLHYPPLFPWWVASSESPTLKPPLWSWWGLQSQRLTNVYRFPHFSGTGDDEKPSQSYIGLIAEAILSSPEEKLILSDIYGFILTNYPYFRNKGTGWRNSIRHNLSLNDCFVKAGRSQNGKGHFWAINHLYIDDFRRGDFRRKRTYKRPSRGKKARANLEGIMMKKKGVPRYQAQGSEQSSQMDNKVDTKVPPDTLTVFKTEQIDKQFVDDQSRARLPQIKEEMFMEPDHLCGQPQEPKMASKSERVVPSSPEWSSDDFHDESSYKTDFEKEHSKGTHFETTRELEDDSVERFREIKTRHNKPFDMDTLLAPARNPRDFGILREMYPMYYNIMNLGMKNLDPSECYGSPVAYCGHCCSMLESFTSNNREAARRHSYPLPSNGADADKEKDPKDCME